MIKLVLVWSGVALGGVILIAVYWNFSPTNTAKQNLGTFGLLGDWSFDCASKGRTTFTAPFFGNPTGISTDGNENTYSAAEIKSATRLTDDKLKIVSLITKVPDANKKNDAARQEGEIWQTVYERIGKKMRVMEIEREDGKKVVVKNGYFYETREGKEPTKTTNFALFLEKCLNWHCCH